MFSHSVYVTPTGYRHDGISPGCREEHIKCARFSSSGKDIWKVRFYHGYCCKKASEAQGCSAPGKQPGDFDLGCTVLSSSLERQIDPPLLMAKEHRGKGICRGKAKREEIFYRHKRRLWMRGSASLPWTWDIQATLLLLACIKYTLQIHIS